MKLRRATCIYHSPTIGINNCKAELECYNSLQIMLNHSPTAHLKIWRRVICSSPGIFQKTVPARITCFVSRFRKTRNKTSSKTRQFPRFVSCFRKKSNHLVFRKTRTSSKTRFIRQIHMTAHRLNYMKLYI